MVDPLDNVALEGIISLPPNTNASPLTRLVVLFQFPLVAPVLKVLSCLLFSSSNRSTRSVLVVPYVSMRSDEFDEDTEDPLFHVSLGCADIFAPVPRYRKLLDDIEASVFWYEAFVLSNAFVHPVKLELPDPKGD